MKLNKKIEIEEEQNDNDLQVIFSEIQFQFPMDCFNQSNCIYLYFNQFDFNYIKIFNNSKRDHSIRISLNNISLNNLKRNIISSKDEYLLIVLNIKDSNNLNIVSNSLLNSLSINLSYKDIIIIYQIILDFQKMFNIVIKSNNSKIQNNENNNKKTSNFLNSYSSSKRDNERNFGNLELKNENVINNINSIISEINIESINITLLEDNNLNSNNINCFYYPFLNINFYKATIHYESNKTEKEEKFNFNNNLLVNYYNDTNKIWEPLTEDLIVKLDYIYITENNKLIENYTLEINKFILNISDEFINMLLIKLNNWFYQLTKQYKYTKKIIERKKNAEVTLFDNVIIKYIIHNCTDLDLNISYESQKYNVDKYNKLCIEFSDDNLHRFKNNLEEFIVIECYKNKIIVFGEEFGIKNFKISVNGIERDIYVETKLNKNQYIDIYITNPILINNYTNYTFQINLSEINKGNESSENILHLPPGINFSLTNEYLLSEDSSSLNLELIQDPKTPPIPLKNKISLKDLISADVNKDILFNNINLSLISKNNSKIYKKIIISNKYCINNCLPCSLYINDVEIKNNSSFNLDDISLLTEHNSIKLKLKTLDKYFYSKLSLKRNETKKLIKFSCTENKESIILPILIKETPKIKIIVIYSEYILYNNSGIELNISSQDENNINYLHNIGNDIFLISSEIKQSNAYLCLKSNKNIFEPNYIQYEQIIKKEMFEFTLNIEDKLKTNNYNLDLIISKNKSSIWCENDKSDIIKIYKEELDSISLYTIIPKYNIINTKTKKINIILKSNDKYYMGINIANEEGIKDIKNFYIFDTLALNSLYTICIKEKLYNVMVKKAKNGGYKELYIVSNNLKYSQVIVENKTNYDITLKQKEYEKYKQLIERNKTQTLKIYGQANHIFSIEIDNKLYYFNLNDAGKKHLINNLYLNISQNKYNANSKNVTIYFQHSNIDLNNDFIHKSKSVMNLPKIAYRNFKINYTQDKYIKINIIFNHLNISVIGQNKNTSGEIYDRKEIALIY